MFYNFRLNLSAAKIQGLTQTIKATQYKHRNKKLKFYIESADEYRKVIRSADLTNDHCLTLLSDAMCFVFATKLNRINSFVHIQNDNNDQFYSLIRHQIRLHTYHYGEKTFKDTRDNRL